MPIATFPKFDENNLRTQIIAFQPLFPVLLILNVP